jgi:hypothetical protein
MINARYALSIFPFASIFCCVLLGNQVRRTKRKNLIEHERERLGNTQFCCRSNGITVLGAKRSGRKGDARYAVTLSSTQIPKGRAAHMHAPRAQSAKLCILLWIPASEGSEMQSRPVSF